MEPSTSQENTPLENKQNDGSVGFSAAKSRKRKQPNMDTDDISNPSTKRPHFKPVKAKPESGSAEVRKVRVPNNRYTPLQKDWLKIFTPIVEHLKLNIRFNKRARLVELKAGKETVDIGALQKAEDFLRAFMLGFEVDDSLALVRLDHLFLETFDVTDAMWSSGMTLAFGSEGPEFKLHSGQYIAGSLEKALYSHFFIILWCKMIIWLSAAFFLSRK